MYQNGWKTENLSYENIHGKLRKNTQHSSSKNYLAKYNKFPDTDNFIGKLYMDIKYIYKY